MTVENFYYKSSNLKNDIYATIFMPEKERKVVGIVQFVHGMCEYMGKYDEFANYLTSKGFIVCGEDHLGHGRTAEIENLGKLNETDSMFNFVQDIRLLYNFMRKKYGSEIPYHFIGHSMGSFILRTYISWYKTSDIASVTLCATSGSRQLVEKLVKYLEIDMKYNGGNSENFIMDKLLLKQNEKQPEFNNAVYAMLNSNEYEKARRRDDPYSNFLFSNRAFYVLLSMLAYISEDEWYESIDKDLKILLISGELDAVGRFGNGVREVYSKLVAAGIKNVNYKLYKDARHEILTETIRMTVFDDVYRFMIE